jgi:hypothetical protein
MVHIAVKKKGLPERERFVVGSSAREDAEANIRSLYPSDLSIRLFALAPSGIEAETENVASQKYQALSPRPFLP